MQEFLSGLLGRTTQLCMATCGDARSMVAATGDRRVARRMWVAIFAGGTIVFIALGLRHSFGLFLDPVTRAVPGITRETFGFAVAVQNLLWGLSQPFAGMVADRYGSGRVIFVGGLLYASGLAVASISAGPLQLQLGLGLLVGLGLGCTSYAVVLGAVGRGMPSERRSGALGLTSVGGSVGIFCSVPLTLGLIAVLEWSWALVALACVATAICLLASSLSGRPESVVGEQSLRAALREALGHRGFVLLVLGFFVCGFQLAFIATHLPAFLLDRGQMPWVGGAALAMIGAANIAGTLACGFLGDQLSKRRLLAFLYVVRAAVVVWFVTTPISPTTTIIFAAVIGLTWLGTVPLTSGIVAQVFGPRYLATLVGIVFLMHQIGSFLGAWLGGFAFEQLGSYDAIWWAVALLGLAAAALHLPIDERPLARLTVSAAQGRTA
jgi:predicted MFS family arabinose efflux permease